MKLLYVIFLLWVPSSVMVSKLIFKGDKKKEKKKKVKVHKNDESIKSKNDKSFPINGKQQKLCDINIETVTNGWTTMYNRDLSAASHSILDESSGNLPIMISHQREDKMLCLKTIKSNEDKSELIFSEDFEKSLISNIIEYTDNDVFENDNLRYRVEPKDVSYVFILNDVSTLFQSSTKFVNGSSKQKKAFSIKSSDGKYIEYNPTENTLSFTHTLTQNGMFSLIEETSNNLPYYRLILGEVEDYNTMIITKNNDIKVIPDPEDLLMKNSRFLIRIRKEDALITKQIVKEYQNQNMNNKDNSGDGSINGKIKQTVLELTKLGFKINDRIFSQISEAYLEGNLNQWIVEFKEKNLNDRFT